jgi:hypothetical protein
MSDDEMICLEPNCEDSEPPKEMPSTYDMLKGFIKSGKDIVGGVMAGEGLLVEEEVFNSRMDICKTCPMFVQESSRCLECGCFMRAKAMFKKTYCPLHKWEMSE